MRATRILLLLGIAVAGAAIAAGGLRTFDLKHRSAEELIPLIRPLLPEDAALSGRDYLLIIRAPEPALEEAALVVQRLDTRPRQLLVTVSREGSADSTRRGAGIDARGDVHLYGAEGRRDRGSVQQLRTLEGRWARIRTGEAVPLPHRSTRVTPGGPVESAGFEYIRFETGFEVQPRLAGKKVILSIRPFRQERVGGGRYETEELTTTVEGALGEWVEIGLTHEGRVDSETGLIYHRAQRQQSEGRIRLKVELIQ